MLYSRKNGRSAGSNYNSPWNLVRLGLLLSQPASYNAARRQECVDSGRDGWGVPYIRAGINPVMTPSCSTSWHYRQYNNSHNHYSFLFCFFKGMNWESGHITPKLTWNTPFMWQKPDRLVAVSTCECLGNRAERQAPGPNRGHNTSHRAACLPWEKKMACR